MTDLRSNFEPSPVEEGRPAPQALIAGLLALKGRPLALVLIALIVLLRAWDPAPVEGLRLAAFDLLQAVEAHPPENPFVTIVAIDDDSLAAFGQWPWPRTLLARLAERIGSDGPRVIGFDLIFPEPDRMSPERLAAEQPGLDADTVASLMRLPSNDEIFATALAAAPAVLGIAGANTPSPSVTTAPRVTFATRGGDPASYLKAYPGLVSNVVPLTSVAKGAGLLSVESERDGIVRRLPLVAIASGELRSSLGIEMLRVAAGATSILVEVGAVGIDAVVIANVARVPTYRDGRAWLRHRTHVPARFVAARDVLEGRVDRGAFAGKIVIVAATAIGLGDFVTTPVEPHIPGAEVHAQLIEGIAANDILVRPPGAALGEIVVAVALGLAFVILVPVLAAEIGFAALIGALAVLAAIAWWGFRAQGILLDTTTPGAAIVVAFAVALSGTLAAAETARRTLREALEREKLAAQRLEGELAAARDIQMGILPRRFPAFPGREDIDIHALIEPARAVGGDFYDFALIDDGRLFFMIGDVSGKGVPASLFMALSKVLAKSAALREPKDIGDALTRANVEITRENAAEMFVTAFAGVLDLSSGELQYVSAGHDTPYLMSPGTEPVRLEGTGGPPLCVVDDFAYPTDRLRLQRGDTLVLVTDGVTEARNEAGDLLSTQEVWKALGVMPASAAAREIAVGLRDAVAAFVGGAEPADDIAILVVRWP
jgi:serine phosphatase RsbU (regulator of sigma subunit)